MADQPLRTHHSPLSSLETTFTSGVVIWREAQWGDMRVGYETYLQDYDDAALLQGLPDNRCQCPHWGFVLVGRMTVRYADHEDVVNAGELYHMAPGHSIAVDAGTVLVEVSPMDKWRELMDIAERNLARLRDVSGDTW